MIKFFLQPNPVTPDPNDQSARVRANETLDMAAIVKRAAQRGTSLTETDLMGAGNLLFDVIGNEVANGNNVALPLFNMRPSIKGVFTNAADGFDSSRHIKTVTISGGTMMIEKMRAAKVEKVLADLPAPVLLEYTDINSSTTNSLLTPGGIGSIVGEELKYDPNNPLEGIYFIPSDGSPAVKAAIIANRTEGRLMFSVPAGLVTGNYIMEVRRGYGNNGTIRNGSLNDTLEVA